MAEMVVALIDDPKRSKNVRQVDAYAELAPRQYESGTMTREGKITKQGNSLIHKLLV